MSRSRRSAQCFDQLTTYQLRLMFHDSVTVIFVLKTDKISIIVTTLRGVIADRLKFLLQIRLLLFLFPSDYVDLKQYPDWLIGLSLHLAHTVTEFCLRQPFKRGAQTLA